MMEEWNGGGWGDQREGENVNNGTAANRLWVYVGKLCYIDTLSLFFYNMFCLFR